MRAQLVGRPRLKLGNCLADRVKQSSQPLQDCDESCAQDWAAAASSRGGVEAVEMFQYGSKLYRCAAAAALVGWLTVGAVLFGALGGAILLLPLRISSSKFIRHKYGLQCKRCQSIDTSESHLHLSG